MSNEIRRAFHPGSYLKDYLEEMQLTQDEFSKRVGITSKQVSLLVSEEANITPDIAYKLSSLMGTTTEFWLNLQARFDAYQMALKAQEKFDNEVKIYKMIDKSFLKETGIIDEKDDLKENISKLRTNILVSSLEILTKQDFTSQFRKASDIEEDEKNFVCKNVWVSLASKIAKEQEVSEFNEAKLNFYIDYFRNLTILEPSEFYPALKEKLNECGVAFIILPALKNSNINGVVRWIDNNKVMLAMNDRGKTDDKFWFSFFHELKHVLQKAKRKTILGFDNDSNYEDLEKEADEFSKETLIPSKALATLTSVSKNDIINFARSNNIAPGIVVGRLQKEGMIPYSAFNDLKKPIKII